MSFEQSEAADATVWSRIERGFYVASRAGDFLGFVDGGDDGFVARDRHSKPIGAFADLPAAMQAVTDGVAEGTVTR